MPVAQRQAAGERSGGLYPPASTKSNWRWMCLQAMEQVAARQQLGAKGDDGVDLAVQAPPPPHCPLYGRAPATATAMSQSLKAAGSAAIPLLGGRVGTPWPGQGSSHRERSAAGTSTRASRYFELRRSRPGSPPPTQRLLHHAIVPPTTLCPSW
ncbi:hypothetical protein THAR02_01374 [Trichoderma harzianum]|uniref:Uncharacterized protein n=1 Tax=Trichoderma harzianum TaxID=5544 RepID=A0A0F9XPS4_TRIHA|nr:hypothetical protein THAR02_01374 [Trichoderma harzianum]